MAQKRDDEMCSQAEKNNDGETSGKENHAGIKSSTGKASAKKKLHSMEDLTPVEVSFLQMHKHCSFYFRPLMPC